MHCDDKGKKRMKKAVGSVAQKAAEGADSLLAEARQDVADVKKPEPAVDKSTEDMAEAVSKVKGSAEETATENTQAVMQDTTKLINSFEFSGNNKKLDKQFLMESLNEVQDSIIVETKQGVAEFITDLHRTQMDEEGVPLLGQDDFKKLSAFVSDEPREEKAEGGLLKEDMQKYLMLLDKFEESVDKAKNKKERDLAIERFKDVQESFDPEVIALSLEKLDEDRMKKVFGGNVLKTLDTIGKKFFAKAGDSEGGEIGGMLQKIKAFHQKQDASISNLEGPDPIEPTNNMPSIGYAEGGDVEGYAEGGETDMPEDTYPNIPEDEMAIVIASQLPDDAMEEEYTEYVLGESLSDDEQDYLLERLAEDDRLGGIFDKIMDTAGEFAGDGAVKGPGDGTSDSIPARLSDGEFVFTKKAVDVIGADKLQEMMDDAERDYDEDRDMKYGGGMMDSLLDNGGKDYDEEVHNQMLSANAMPSVRR
jgi:hypothetical protein